MTTIPTYHNEHLATPCCEHNAMHVSALMDLRKQIKQIMDKVENLKSLNKKQGELADELRATFEAEFAQYQESLAWNAEQRLNQAKEIKRLTERLQIEEEAVLNAVEAAEKFRAKNERLRAALTRHHLPRHASNHDDCGVCGEVLND